jgi:UDP-galactopyranose mutase
VRTYDWIVVGAGFVGAVVAERLSSQLDKRVLLVDRRNHIGGNAYDCVNQHGHLIHRYGGHIFHTNAQRVVDYLSKFTDWIDYEHRVVGMIGGRLVPIPFNLTSIDILFPAKQAAALKDELVSAYDIDTKIPILTLRQSNDPTIRELADFIYANVFSGYTRKQWGLEPEQLNPSVTGRVPVHLSYDDRYFQDRFQKMPAKGYTRMFERILADDRIHVELNVSITPNDLAQSKSSILFTGAIDEFFSYCYGPLEYRSLEFDFQTYQVARHQSVAQVNYPASHDFTRIIEFGHLTGQRDRATTVAIEYPRAHNPGQTIPYYPVPTEQNAALYARYEQLAAEAVPHIVFAGRLADYRYYNMDQAIGRALSVFERRIIRQSDVAEAAQLGSMGI